MQTSRRLKPALQLAALFAVLAGLAYAAPESITTPKTASATEGATRVVQSLRTSGCQLDGPTTAVQAYRGAADGSITGFIVVCNHGTAFATGAGEQDYLTRVPVNAQAAVEILTSAIARMCPGDSQEVDLLHDGPSGRTSGARLACGDGQTHNIAL